MHETCKYCRNFYSTLCPKCRVNTGNLNDADFSCDVGAKKVQENWKAYEKAVHFIYGDNGNVIDIKGFLLPKVPEHPENCQLCGKKLTEYELRNPGEIRWVKDGKLMEVASAYYCFDCVQKVTGEKIKEPDRRVVRDDKPLW